MPPLLASPGLRCAYDKKSLKSLLIIEKECVLKTMKTMKIMLAGAVVAGFAALAAQAEEAEVPAPEAVVETPAAPEAEMCGECGRPKPPKHVELCKECGRPKFDGMRKGPKGQRGPRGEFKQGERKQIVERPNLKRGKRPVRMHTGEVPPPPPAPEATPEEAPID